VKGNGSGLNEGTTLILLWKDWGKIQNVYQESRCSGRDLIFTSSKFSPEAYLHAVIITRMLDNITEIQSLTFTTNTLYI